MKRLFTVLFFFAAALQAQPTVAGLSNALSQKPTFSPGSLVSVYGTGLIVGTTLPSVTVAGLAAYVFPAPSSISTQLLIQLPVNAAVGPTTLTVTAGGQTSPPANLTLAAYAPAFSANAAGVGSFTDVEYAPITS